MHTFDTIVPVLYLEFKQSRKELHSTVLYMWVVAMLHHEFGLDNGVKLYVLQPDSNSDTLMRCVWVCVWVGVCVCVDISVFICAGKHEICF